jgi:glycosyltransferase involved in cell wall biosynthesis
LFDKLVAEGGDEIEVLLLLDNKKRSIGAKRQALLDMAIGRFIAFVDDDDDVSEDYIERLLDTINKNMDADVIVFDQICTLDDLKWVVRFGLQYENEQLGAPEIVVHRKPWHICAWRDRIAKRCVFPSTSYGEDGVWVKQAIELADIEKQVVIEGAPMHYYKYSSTGTEAFVSENVP